MTLYVYLLSQHESAQSKGRANDKHPNLFSCHSLPQFFGTAAGRKAILERVTQQFLILFKQSVRGDFIHSKEDIVLDHILKPVGQQSRKADRYTFSGLT